MVKKKVVKKKVSKKKVSSKSKVSKKKQVVIEHVKIPLPPIKEVKGEEKLKFSAYKFPPLKEVNPNPPLLRVKKKGLLSKLLKRKQK